MEFHIVEILVSPGILKSTAANLVQRARRIRSALIAVDEIMMQLDATQFEGIRAAVLLVRYRKMRDKVVNWPSIIENFSRDLESTAAVFERADRNQ